MSPISIPELSLVVLVGASGSGKSTFAAKHFLPTEIISSDFCRGLVADDENDQTVTADAFEVLHFIAAKRLEGGRMTVVDATNVQPESRRPLVSLARRYHCLPVAIVLDVPQRLCEDRNAGRADRTFGHHVIRRQTQQLRRSLKRLKREGFRHVYVLRADEVDEAVLERTKLWCDRREDHGPFDVIGDVHGCADELEELLGELSYEVREEVDSALGRAPLYVHPEGRRAVFVGDLVDRGPRVLDTVRIVATMVGAGEALCVPGNHDTKLVRALRGRNVQITHGLDKSLAEIEAVPEDEQPRLREGLIDFLDGLVSHFVLDDGRLVVAHAGMREEMQGRGSGSVRAFALYGETTGETDEFGLPIRYDWASEYKGPATVVYGHTPVPEPEWVNRTINVDTGCVFGGQLTALRYPENELVSIPARQTYSEPLRPAARPAPDDARSTQQQLEDVLDLSDVAGKRIVSTRLMRNVTVREENAAAALEVMSRFAIDPKWLIYLPPTMSPSKTTSVDGLLEHPRESFGYFLEEGVPRVICQEKHMGSRAVFVVCRDEEVSRRRFGVEEPTLGVCYTRTGRRFFADDERERSVLERVSGAVADAGIWDELDTDWVCMDAEVMPWSVKAQDLLRDQYAAVGAAAQASLAEAGEAIGAAGAAGIDVEDLGSRFGQRAEDAQAYVDAYRRYCWSVDGLEGLRIAPFHLLASEGAVHVDKDHAWHMDVLGRLCSSGDEMLMPTPYRVVDVTDPDATDAACRWWDELTGAGGEGIVVKPFSFVARSRQGLVQPGVKCRGREYLRIIYGPEYTRPEHLERLRRRNLGHKRSLALREFGLGIEGLERFVRREPLRRVHECVFAVLALESEPVDPRL